MLNLGTESEAGNKTWQQALLIIQQPAATLRRYELTPAARNANCETLFESLLHSTRKEAVINLLKPSGFFTYRKV